MVGEQINKYRVIRIIARMNVGGPAIQISGLMKNIDERFEQLLLTGSCGPDEIDYLDANGISVSLNRVRGLGQRIHLMNDCRAFLQIRKIIKEFKPEIVHTHTAKAGLLGRLAVFTIRRQIATIHTYHGHLLQGYFGSFKRNAIVLIEKLLARSTTALISVGEKVRDDLLSAGVGTKDKFHVVGPGLEISKIPSRKNAITSLHIAPGPFTVAWIGRAVAVKAPYRVLEIAEECEQLGINVRFLFVGNGPLEKDLQRIANLKKLNVKFLGWQTSIEPILSASDLVILTSLNEGTPIALIQAQMAGIPVLATSVGSTSEVMLDGTSGYSIPYSKETFSNLIKAFSENPQKCRKFGECGKAYALEKFSLQNLVKAHEEIYEKILNQSNF